MQLRVLTHNIHHGLGVDGRIDLERIIDSLQASGADIIALNEADKYRRRSRYINQARWLAKRLGMHYRFAAGYRRFFGQTGNAILSKFPIQQSSILHLVSAGEPRVALKVLAKAGALDITCICVHLGLSPEERLCQVQQLLDIVGKEGKRSILMGDFNAPPVSREVRAISSALYDAVGDRENMATFPTNAPKERIDYTCCLM